MTTTTTTSMAASTSGGTAVRARRPVSQVSIAAGAASPGRHRGLRGDRARRGRPAAGRRVRRAHRHPGQRRMAGVWRGPRHVLGDRARGRLRPPRSTAGAGLPGHHAAAAHAVADRPADRARHGRDQGHAGLRPPDRRRDHHPGGDSPPRRRSPRAITDGTGQGEAPAAVSAAGASPTWRRISRSASHPAPPCFGQATSKEGSRRRQQPNHQLCRSASPSRRAAPRGVEGRAGGALGRDVDFSRANSWTGRTLWWRSPPPRRRSGLACSGAGTRVTEPRTGARRSGALVNRRRAVRRYLADVAASAPATARAAAASRKRN